MPKAVWIHVLWMLAAVAVGTWAGYLGLIRATLKGGKSFLPGRFTLRAHKWTGLVFYAMLYADILYAVLMVQYLFPGEPEGLWAWHEHLALAIGAIYLPGMILGIHMLYRPPGARRARPIIHMVLNFTACALVGVQIVVAAYAKGWLH
jgi:hypothetical protein